MCYVSSDIIACCYKELIALLQSSLCCCCLWWWWWWWWFCQNVAVNSTTTTTTTTNRPRQTTTTATTTDSGRQHVKASVDTRNHVVAKSSTRARPVWRRANSGQDLVVFPCVLAQLCRWRGRRRRLAVQCVRDASCSPAPRCLLTVATRRVYSNTEQFSEWVSLVDTPFSSCESVVRITSPGSLYVTTCVALAITTKSSRRRRSPTDWPTNWPTDWPV